MVMLLKLSFVGCCSSYAPTKRGEWRSRIGERLEAARPISRCQSSGLKTGDRRD